MWCLKYRLTFGWSYADVIQAIFNLKQYMTLSLLPYNLLIKSYITINKLLANKKTIIMRK